jgi:hypothetical protein
MITECDLDPDCGGEIMNAILAPFLRILPERDLAGVRRTSSTPMMTR